MQSVQPVKLSKGTVLFKPGDACRAYLLVAQGSVQIRLIDDGGHSITLYRVEDGESCVLTTSCLLASSAYAAEGVVEKDTTGFTLNPIHFAHLLDTSVGFRRFVFAAFGGRLTEMMTLVNEVAFHRLDQRLAEWLTRQSEDPISATHQQIADELGTAREVVSRQLKEFEHKGWVSLSRGSVTRRDMKALQSLCNTGH